MVPAASSRDPGALLPVNLTHFNGSGAHNIIQDFKPEGATGLENFKNVMYIQQ